MARSTLTARHLRRAQAFMVPERDARATADHLQRYVDEPDTLIADGIAPHDQICCDFDIRNCWARLRVHYDAVQ